MRLSRILFVVVTFVAITVSSVAFAENVETELTTDLDATPYSTSTIVADDIESTSDYSTTDVTSTTDLMTTDEPFTTETTTIDEANATESTTTEEIDTTELSTTEENAESTSTDTIETTTFIEDELTTVFNRKKVDKKCKDGLLLPAWRPTTNLTWGDKFSRGLCYFLAMCYLFLGESKQIFYAFCLILNVFVFILQALRLFPIVLWLRLKR